MPANFTWRQHLIDIAPTWLKENEWGQKLLWTFGLQLDGVQDWENQGKLARMPQVATPTALPAIGRDRLTPQGPDEPPEAYAVRLRRAIDDAKVLGSGWSIVRQLRAFFFGHDFKVATVDVPTSWGTAYYNKWIVRNVDGTEDLFRIDFNWNWDNIDRSPNWGKFWVIVWPDSFIVAGPNCGDGSVCGDPTLTLGTNATPQQVAAVRQIVRMCKMDGTQCVKIVVALDPSSFDPETTPGTPDGTWTYESAYVGNTRQPHRLLTARYWDPDDVPIGD